MLHTYKENEAGALIQLHGVGVRQLQHGFGVPGELVALDVVQHLHSPLPRDHIPLGVQDDESRDACGGRKTRWDQPKSELASDRVWGGRPFPIASGSGRSPVSNAASLQLKQSRNQGPWILFLS